MFFLRSGLPSLVLAIAATASCGGADGRRTTPEGDGGPDGGSQLPGAGGRGAGGAATGGSSAGGAAAGGTAAGGGGGAGGGPGAGGAPVLPADAGAGGAPIPLDGAPGADGTTDSGPVLGEYCVFPDALLEDEVRQALSNLSLDGGVPSGPIPVALAARLTDLESFCDCADARDLTGIECLTGLRSLRLSDIYPSLSPLRWLPDLTTLTLDYQSTLPPGIGALTQLRTLELRNNTLTDLSGLAGLTGLTELNVAGNLVTDLGPLAGLTGLVNLSVYNNRITSIAPLAGLTSLVRLDVGYNGVSDLTPLEGLTNLAYLDVTSSAPITDFSPLVRNTGLGAGDELYANPQASDCASFKDDVAALAARGVTVSGTPICP